MFNNFYIWIMINKIYQFKFEKNNNRFNKFYRFRNLTKIYKN